jgi:4-methylaminobutanoate oxidase (formaldehyde-forming)
MLNVRGGYESDVTISRLADTEFLVLTGTAQAVRDLDWVRRNIRQEARCTVTDVTGAYSVLPVMGPKSRSLLERVGRNKLDNAAFPFGAVKTLEIGYANVLGCRRTYMGELGWELYVPTEFVTSVYDTLHNAGADLGLVDAGYYAIEALRLEKGYRAWGRELTPDVNPYEAGLGFAVKLDKGCDFIGRTALIAARESPPKTRVVSLVAIDTAAPMAHGGEALLRDGTAVGEVTSAAFGAALDRVVMLATLRTDGEAVTEAMLQAQKFEVDIGSTRIAVRAGLKAPYDPGNDRVRA